MLREEISSDGPIHTCIYCSQQISTHNFHGQVKLDVTIE